MQKKTKKRLFYGLFLASSGLLFYSLFSHYLKFDDFDFELKKEDLYI